MDWQQECQTAVILFFTVVISNFVARVVLKRTGWHFFGLKNYAHGAMCVTTVAVAWEAAWLSWSAPTVTSVAVGLLLAFAIMEQREDEREEEQR